MSFRAALHLALWFLLVAALGGCSSLPFMNGKATDAEPQVQREPQFRLVVDAPSDLSKLLRQHLDLARLQYAAEADALTRGEIDRLIGAASAQALSLLQTEGYFNPVVKVARVDDGAEPPLLRMTVTPGPRATIDRLTLEVQGGLYDEVEEGDARAIALSNALQAEWALQPGTPFEQSAWDGAKNRVIATLRSNGYLSAQWSGTAAQVNADTNSVRLFLVADSGALFRVGTIRTAGLERFDEGAVLPAARELIGENGVTVPLSTGEYDLLLAFVERPQRVLSREQLLDLARGRATANFDRAIDTQVSRLRKKIEQDAADPKIIKTVWGGGYTFAAAVTVE